MPTSATVAGGRVQLIDTQTGRSVAQSAIGAFDRDYSEFALDLKDVPAPVESAGSQPSAYQLKTVLTDKTGNQVASAEVPVKLQSYQFSWLPNNIGISDQTIAPWTPIQLRNDTVSLWNKIYTLSGAGIANHIVNSGVPQLAGPMVLEAVVDGHLVTLSGAAPTAVHQSPAAVDLAGEARSPGLTVNTNTRVEFDGFVWNSMTVQPTKSNVGMLSLVVSMPVAEGSFFVTTSGGWSSYFGDTPDKWDSRESSLPAMKGSFVPYVLLTDSERGFSVFADNEKGWRLDPALPAQELQKHDGLVTLRVHFINKAGPIERPLTIQYGWMVTPQKPQPAGWRGYLIDSKKYYPQATPVFWNDADWNVLWPYFSSPFPHDYDKSRSMLNATSSRGVVGCVGNIAHAIARYTDYQGRHFDAFAADWGNPPGSTSNGDIARSRGPNDFDLFHFDRWSKLSGLGCIYFDENYLAEDWNYLTGSAYLLPDGKVQPGYDYLGLREYNKRLRYMFHQNGKPAPNLWEHTTGGQPVYAWMPDVSMEGENVEPTDLTADYIDMLPSSRLRSIGMGRNLGSAPFIMCQALRHGKGETSKILVHQFVGWVLAHDVLPEGVPFWPPLAAELELWRDDVRFLPWWVKGDRNRIDRLRSDRFCAYPARERCTLGRQHRTGKTRPPVFALTATKKSVSTRLAQAIQAYDAEDGTRYTISGGVLTVPVPKRMWRAVRLNQAKLLGRNLSFFADFEHEIAATEARGGRYPLGNSLPGPVEGGKSGKGAPIESALSFSVRHHVSGAQGAISFDVRFRTSNAGNLNDGALVSVGDLALKVTKGVLELRGAGLTNVGVRSHMVLGDQIWHSVTLAWVGNDVWVSCDGAIMLAARLNAPFQLPGMGRGTEIRDNNGPEPAQVIFGPASAIIDNLRMETTPPALVNPAKVLFQESRAIAPNDRDVRQGFQQAGHY